MARKPVVDMAVWPSLGLEGNLIVPAMIAQIAAPKDDEETRQSYGIRKGLTIREEIATAFRVGQSHFDAFLRIKAPSAEATRRFMRDFLTETFGFEDLVTSGGAISFIAGGRVPVVVVPPNEEKLDRRSVTLSTDRSRSPAVALQDYLNDNDDCLWGLVTNGTVIRLMRDNASLTRPAYIEADLTQIFVNEDAASFAVLWLLLHRTRFGSQGNTAADCALERWRDAGAREGETARDRLAGQVQSALKLLGSGFLEANPDLAARLMAGEISLTDWFNELLRLVYRLIFLMVAEDRNLLHPPDAPADARKLYADGYSLTALRAQCFRGATWDKHHDRYEGVKITFHALATGQDVLALPALGGLFADGALPHLTNARLRNHAFMQALYRLSWLAEKASMVPVNWRAMETEELGSVYESLLELQPQLGDDGRSLVFASEAAEQKGNQRKTTGSYYTPDSLVQALLDTALDPVLDRIEVQADDPVKALLRLSVIDPACGSGHFLLAAARRIATRLARIRAEGTPSLADFRHALRDVARYCIHGVDRNPMAVELTKVALWIETVDPGLPLGFFDAQIRCGDALLGVFDLKVLEKGIPDAAYKPLIGDDKATAKYYLQANTDAKKGQGGFDFGTGQSSMPALRPLALDFSGFRALPEDTVEQIRAKAERFEELCNKQEFIQAEAAADLYVGTFLMPKTGGLPSGAFAHTVPTTAELRADEAQGDVRKVRLDAAKAARQARAFHWPLEFPDVMQGGGFDVVLGNPPWERIKLQEQEFFAARSPEIASAPNKAARDLLIKALRDSPAGSAERALSDAFIAAKRQAEATSEFVRVVGEDGGRFVLTGRGDVNTYALFAELFSKLSRLRAGVIVPTGIATDATTAPFFALLVEQKRLASLVDFENREKLFPAVDSRMKFCLLTLGRDEEEARFAFFLTDAAQLAEPERNFTLSAETIAGLNPNTRTVPVFRSRADAELTAKIHQSTPILRMDAKSSNPWGFDYMTKMFDMADNSGEFADAKDIGVPSVSDGRIRADVPLQGQCVPLYEAKNLHIFDHRWSSFDVAENETIDVVASKKEETTFEIKTRYWVRESRLLERLQSKDWTRQWLMGWRDITNATNERTTIAGFFPRCAAAHTLRVMFLGTDAKLAMLFVGCLSSLVFDYVARQKIGGTHLTVETLKQLPVLEPSVYGENDVSFLLPRLVELVYTSASMRVLAEDAGYAGPPFPWNTERRAFLRAELDAYYARMYGLTRDELRYILDPAEVKGPDYPSETFRVLKEKEIRQYGEYRTRSLVLEAWDRMAQKGELADTVML
ncbi:Eco57I restriction-modification methylase domain-containing protein [Paraburkholderia sabiae]|uniref:site-specific DNA-methyltransferase (adenine-specific) n=1 Tax=Paraburkholderia sabiae TaxID=273251 RepID=A0ABU9QPA8_9BURK|nr:N-6 DNA methylase [Paraburkholderia sabiae]WJZ74368.1 N-6 DNA methylase [Paraburkholderia sabiae]CAD6562575.1 hypothetical protein LMG24235_07814 [Paraburkholderia sabiae]